MTIKKNAIPDSRAIELAAGALSLSAVDDDEALLARAQQMFDPLPGTPAEKTGFRGIRRTAGGIELGDVVNVEVKRDGKSVTTKPELVALP